MHIKKALLVGLLLGFLSGCAAFKPLTERPPQQQWNLLGQAKPDDTERIYRAVFDEGEASIQYLLADLDSSVPVDGYCSFSYLSVDPVVVAEFSGNFSPEDEALPGPPPGILPDGRIEKRYFAIYIIRSIIEDKYEMNRRCVQPIDAGPMKVDLAFQEIKILLERSNKMDRSLLEEFNEILERNNIELWPQP